jgi:tRNA-uridine 2-sulfurtransferase
MSTPAVIIAVSGGADSLLSLTLLAESGMPVHAVHGLFLPNQDAGRLQALERICASLGVPLAVLDLAEEFSAAIIAPFVRAYLAGLTPNPCCHCNPGVKFGLLFQRAMALLPPGQAPCSPPVFATGHYAALTDHPHWGRMLTRPLDPHKDQTYFLALLPKAALERARFPLAGVRKRDVPDLLRQRGLEPPVPEESQEICFIPDNDYRGFVQRAAADRDLALNLELPGPGPVLDSAGRQLGMHQGLWRYTQGQRRGLGIAHHEPLYVLGKDIARNALLVGGKGDFAPQRCLLPEPNFFAPPEQWPGDVLAQTRYRQRARPARIELTDQGLLVDFPDQEPDTPPAPGQLCAVYTPDSLLLAGGIIAPNLGAEA